MKKLFTVLSVILLTTMICAQSPQKMSYQAVVRDLSNNLIKEQPVGMKVSILQGSVSGTPMYAETHTPTTNANGLITLAIGTGTPVINAFTDVDWSAGPYFIKTETDPAGGTNYTITATSELLSVPYALHAKAANQLELPYLGLVENSTPGFSVSNLGGAAIYGNSDKPDGSTYGVMGKTISPQGTGVYGSSTSNTGNSFGVWGNVNSENGIGVYGKASSTTGINTGVYGSTYSSSGYGVRGSASSTSGQTYGVAGEAVSSEGVGVIGFANSTTGAAKGVWGLSNAIDGTGVLGESKYIGVRGINLSTTGFAYGVQGEVHSPDGIAVMGYSSSETGSSTGIYGTSASSLGKGVYGENKSTTGSSYGVYGYSASSSGTGVYGESYRCGVMGNNNAITGEAYGVRGKVYSSQGIAVEGQAWSLTGNTHGVYGTSASVNGTGLSGFCSSNTGVTKGVVGYINSPDGFSGYFAGGKFHVRGRVGIGTETPGAGIHLKGTGFPDTFMFLESEPGNDAGFRIYEGTTAKWHIFNDVNAGGLRMYNTTATTAIFLKQSNSFVGINTITPAYNLEVNGTAGKTGGGSWSTSSDIRLKDVTGNYTKGLKEITALQPVSFVYKAGNARHLPTDVPQIGFVAQEVQKAFPEAVTIGEDGYLDFNIHAINVALVNAVKELKIENDRLQTENSELKATSEKNEARMTDIENILRAIMNK